MELLQVLLFNVETLPFSGSTQRFCVYVCDTESLELKGTIEGHLVQLPAENRDTYSSIMLLRALPSLTLNISRDGASTNFLGNLLQCLTTLTVKKLLPYIQSKSPLC